MDVRIETIKLFLLDAHRKNQDLRFRCGHGSSDRVFIVEVLPLDVFKADEEYAQAEYDFCISFENEYPNNDIIFVSEGDICSVQSSLFEVGYEHIVKCVPNHSVIKSAFSSNVTVSNHSNNYFLAA